MSLPPGPLATDLVEVFPQFILCNPTLSAALAAYLSPTDNPALSDLIQWLQDHPDVALAAGDCLNPPATPQTTASPLDPGLVAAMAGLITATSAWIATQPDFAEVAWSVQPGIVPGPVLPQPAGPSWHITTQSPTGGLVFSDIAYGETPAPAFSLTLKNPLPRHLAVYAVFSKNGVVVAPSGWSTRLPAKAPGAFESATIKYLGLVRPDAPVAGLAPPPGIQQIQCPLPANADAVQILFGGLGQGDYAALPDAAGVLFTFVLDVFVPWVIAYSGATPAGLAAWYGGVLADPALIGNILAGGDFLTKISGSDVLFAALAENLTPLLLGASLAGLRQSITQELGTPPDVTWGWVDQLAPAAGWAAQLVATYLAPQVNPQFWASQVPPRLTLDLSPASALTLAVTLQPDPATGVWPYSAARWQVTCLYGGGFTQCLAGDMPPSPAVTPVTLEFGAIPTAGPIILTAVIADSAQETLARATGRATPPQPPSGRTLAVSLPVADLPTRLAAATRYARRARLAWTGSAYQWRAADGSGGAGASGGGASLDALVALTMQGDQLCLGYAWRVLDQPTPSCATGAQISAPYFIQNIGTAIPDAQLKTLPCGLVAAPSLAYSPSGTGGGYYLDTQGDPWVLRPVGFGPGQFDPTASTGVARFPAQSGAVSLCVHPAGYAALVNADAGLLEIVGLAAAPVADAQAPMALSHAGTGARIGLLNTPCAVAVLPNGGLAVLEQGNARIQAFDLQANPLPIFKGACSLALRQGAEAGYRDLAVSDDGHLFVLGCAAGGNQARDWFLDIYDPDGTWLATTPGVCAAKIALGPAMTLYTLDTDSLTGPGGRCEPIISIWCPTS